MCKAVSRNQLKSLYQRPCSLFGRIVHMCNWVGPEGGLFFPSGGGTRIVTIFASQDNFLREISVQKTFFLPPLLFVE